MTRRGALLALTLLAAGAGDAEAQYILQLHQQRNDTAVGIVPSGGGLVPVKFHTFSQFSSSQVTFVRARISFDPAKISVMNASSGRLTVDSAIASPGLLEVVARGGAGIDSALFHLAIAGLSDPSGAYLRLEIDSIELDFLTSNQVVTWIGQVCRADAQYGDIDRSSAVTSRDALIALSAAVGLNVGAFAADAQLLGDVDADSAVSSRDALLMLTAVLFQSTFMGESRLFSGPPVSCPALDPVVAQDIIFVRDTGVVGLSLGRQLMLMPASSGTPQAIVETASGPGSNAIATPRLAVDGQSVVYSCVNPNWFFTRQACTIRTDGSSQQFLVPQGGQMFTPDWAPGAGSTTITFSQFGSVYRLIGACPGDFFSCGSQLVTLTSPGDGPVWSYDSTRIAFANNGTFVMSHDGTGRVQVPATTGLFGTNTVRWNPASDSVAYYTSLSGFSNKPGLWLAQASGGGGARRHSAIEFHSSDQGYLAFDWGASGFVFQYSRPGLRGLWLLPLGGGPPRRLTANRDNEPSYRRPL